MLETRLGRLNLDAPKLRHGSYVPGFRKPRRLIEMALATNIQGDMDRQGPDAQSR
jgi:hypothetical protein